MSREQFTHDESLRQLRELAADEILQQRVSELFVAGVATGMRRAMTPVMSFYAARHLPAHDWVDFDHAAHSRRYKEDEVPCAICGLKRRAIPVRCVSPPSGSAWRWRRPPSRTRHSQRPGVAGGPWHKM